MKTLSIRRRMIQTNLTILISMTLLILVVANVGIHFYIKNSMEKQLEEIAHRAITLVMMEEEAFNRPLEDKPPLEMNEDNDIPPVFFKLDHVLRDSLSVLNADYMILDGDDQLIESYPYDYLEDYRARLENIKEDLLPMSSHDAPFTFTYSGQSYLATYGQFVVTDIPEPFTMIIFGSLAQIRNLQATISIILILASLLILIIGALMAIYTANKIATPIGSVADHLSQLAQRNFSSSLPPRGDDEVLQLIKTSNQLAAQLNEYDQLQQRFFENVSHDLRTPLMSVKGYSEGIVYGVVEPEKAAKIIHESSQQMTDLIEEILYLSSFKPGDVYVHEMVNIDNLLGQVMEICLPLAQLKGRSILIDQSSITEKVIFEGSITHLSRAISNLIINCIRFSEESIKMNLSAADHMLVITISDDGPGIDDEDLPYIFERFYKGKRGNTGLGLAIAKEIIQAHKGQITAIKKDKGAHFCVTLPLN